MRPLHAILPALLAGALTAQAESTTLARLCDRASAVVRARALAVEVDGGQRRVTWRTLEVLHGAAPERFVLREPAGELCGRALGGVVPGQGALVFLAERDGALAPAAGDGRALEPLAAEVLAFARFWLDTRDAGARVRRLAAELGSAHVRVRRDAALTLAELPGLERGELATRLAVAAAAVAALDDRDPSAPSLLRAAVRLQAFECVAPLLERYLGDRHPEARTLLEGSLAALPGTAPAVAAQLPAGSAARRRAVALLARLPLQESRSLLIDLLRTGERGVAVHAGAVLAAAGLAPELLAPELPAELLDAARALAAQPPRFRAVRPEGGR